MSKLFRRFTKTARDSQDVNQNHGSESERPARQKNYRSKPGYREPELPKSSEKENLNEPISSLSQDSTRATPDDHIGNCKQNAETIRNSESHQTQKSHATKSGLPSFVPAVGNTMAEPSVTSAPSFEATVQSPSLVATNGHNGYVEKPKITTQVIKQPRIPQNQAGGGTGQVGTLGGVVVSSPDQGANIIKVQTQQQHEVSVYPAAQALTATGGVYVAADRNVNSVIGSPETSSVSHQLIADASETKQGTMSNSSLAWKPRQSSAFQIRNPETGEVLNSGQGVAKHPKPPTRMQPTLVTPGSQPNGKVQQAVLVQTQPSLAGGASQVVVLQAPASSSPIQFSQLQQAPVFVQTQQPTQMIIQPAQFTLQQPQQQQQVQLQVVPHLILQQQALPVQVQLQAQPSATALSGTSVAAPTLELQQKIPAAGDYLELAPVEESNLVAVPSSSSSSASAFCGVVMGSNTSTAVTVAQMSQCAQMLQQRLIYRQGTLGGSSSTSVVAPATTPSAASPGILVPEVSVESGAVQPTASVFGGSLSQTASRTLAKASDLTRKYLSLSAACTRMRVQNRPLYPNQMLVSLLEQQINMNSGRLKSRKILNVPCSGEHVPTPTVGTTRPQGPVKGRVRAASTSTSTASIDSAISEPAVASAACATSAASLVPSHLPSSRGSKSSLNLSTLPNDVVTSFRDRDRDREREQKLKRRERERDRRKRPMVPVPTAAATSMMSPKTSTPIGTVTTAVDATPKTVASVVATTVCSSESTPRVAPLIYDINDLLEIAVNCEIQVPEEAGRFKIVDAAYGGRSSRFPHGNFHSTGSPTSTSPPPSVPRRNFERGGRSGPGMYIGPSGSIGSCGGPNSIGSVHSMSSGNKWRKEGGPHQPKPLSYYQRDDIKPTTTLKSSRELTREEQFQREVRSLLNKLTVENFLTVAEKLAVLYESLELEQDVDVMVSLVHDKAIAELDYSDMYADLAYLLKYRFNEKLDIGFKSTCFHRTLLNRCQVSFEEINHETLPDDGAAAGGHSSAPSKKWVLGNIRFMGELFLRKIISITILKQISKALMGGAMSGTKHPSEHLTECFTELLTTIGYTMDQSLGGKEMLNDYMNILIKLKDANIYSVRINYRIQDLVELRDKNWQKKLFREKATSVAQIHLEAQQEELRGGTIHVQQMGKYTTAGLQTSRHYSDYLVNQRKLAMTKIQNGVFLGTRDANGAPSNGNCASSAASSSTSAAAAQVVDDSTAADSTASMAPVDVVDRLVTLALGIPSLQEFQDAWKRLKPNVSDAKEICRILCHKATYAKTAAASSALAEIAAHCITKFTSGKDSKVLWEMVGQEFLVRLHDEILDNPRAVGIFATLCMTVFETMPASNFLLLERMQMPQERDTAKELCALVLRGIKSKGGQVQGPRRILQRCFAHSFSDAASVE